MRGCRTGCWCWRLTALQHDNITLLSSDRTRDPGAGPGCSLVTTNITDHCSYLKLSPHYPHSHTADMQSRTCNNCYLKAVAVLDSIVLATWIWIEQKLLTTGHHSLRVHWPTSFTKETKLTPPPYTLYETVVCKSMRAVDTEAVQRVLQRPLRGFCNQQVPPGTGLGEGWGLVLPHWPPQ